MITVLVITLTKSVFDISTLVINFVSDEELVIKKIFFIANQQRVENFFLQRS